MRHLLLSLLLLSVTACVDDPSAESDSECPGRRGWWKDTDGDGFGDPDGEMRIECEDPGEGWVDRPPQDDTDDTDDTDTGDTDTDEGR